MDCSHHAVFKTRKTTFRRSITQFSVSDLDPDSVCCGGFRRGGGAATGLPARFLVLLPDRWLRPSGGPGAGPRGAALRRGPAGRPVGARGPWESSPTIIVWQGEWLPASRASFRSVYGDGIGLSPSTKDHPHRPSFRDAMAPSHRSLVKAHPVRGRRRPAVRRVPCLGPPPRLPHPGEPPLPPLGHFL